MNSQRDLGMPGAETPRPADWLAAQALIREMQANCSPALGFISSFFNLFRVYRTYEIELVESPNTPSETNLKLLEEMLALLRGFAMRAADLAKKEKPEHLELVGITCEQVASVATDLKYREALHCRSQTKERSEEIISSLNASGPSI